MFCWPDCKPKGPLFSAEFVCLSVCLSVCLWPALLPFNVNRFWWNLVSRTVLWSSLAATLMVQIGRRGTARRLFENFKKFSKITEFEFQNSDPLFFLHLCLLCSEKNSTRFEQNWRRRYILKSAPIAITQVWTRHPRPMLCARRKHRILAASTNAEMGDRLATIDISRKVGRGCCGGAGSSLGHHLTQCGLGQGLSLYQVASWSIQPFGHNCRNATLLRVGIPLRTIFIRSLVVTTVRVHSVIARYQIKSSIWCFTTITETF